MTPEQIRIRYERNFIDTEYMLKKKSSSAGLTFRELKIYYTEKGYHLDDRSFEGNLKLKTEEGHYIYWQNFWQIETIYLLFLFSLPVKTKRQYLNAATTVTDVY